MLRQRCFVFGLLVLAAIHAADAQASGNARNKRSGNWAATNASGQRFGGTWTAVLDSTGTTVTGSWTLLDAQGTTVASGGWSAAKSQAQWSGAWRALAAGNPTERGGTWTASIELAGNAKFADLFSRAADTTVSGTWRSGSLSGAWSIRAVRTTTFEFLEQNYRMGWKDPRILAVDPFFAGLRQEPR